jgi:hypothetical protein
MDYSRFMFRPFEEDTVTQLEKYPEFNFNIEDKARVINFMILMYDPNSEIRRTYPDLLTRKREVAKVVGFQLDDDKKFSPHIEQMLLGENHEYNVAMIRFAQMHGIPDFDVLVVTKEMLAKELVAALKETDAKIRTIIQKNIKVNLADIEVLERRIFTGEETQKARESLYHLIEKVRVPRPENMADDIKNKSVDLPDIYKTKKTKK